MKLNRNLVVEADQHSRAALDAALHCLDLGNSKPAFGPAMVSCAFGFAGLGIAIAGIGIFAGIWQAAQAADPEPWNTSAH